VSSQATVASLCVHNSVSVLRETARVRSLPAGGSVHDAPSACGGSDEHKVVRQKGRAGLLVCCAGDLLPRADDLPLDDFGGGDAGGANRLGLNDPAGRVRGGVVDALRGFVDHG